MHLSIKSNLTPKLYKLALLTSLTISTISCATGTEKPVHIDVGTITPPNPIIDEIPPIITINGTNPVELKLGTAYTDAGATAIDDVDGDITNKITITGEVDINAIGNYEIVYTVIDKAGNKSSETKVVNVINQSGEEILPPDPGRVGKQTLEGIDSNNNGVRDDVEIAIYEKYPNNPEVRRALWQEAISTQGTIIAGANGIESELLEAIIADSKAGYCRWEIIGEKLESNELVSADPWMEPINAGKFIETNIVNTNARAVAYRQYAQSFSGGILPDYKGDTPCDWK